MSGDHRVVFCKERNGAMSFKNNIGYRIKNLARILPGIADYQDKEDIRGHDRLIREHLSDMLRKRIKRLNEFKVRVIEAGRIKWLTELDAYTKRLERVADTIRFSSYGYSPVFANDPYDKAKLEQLCQYDISLAQEIKKLDGTLDILAGTSTWERKLSLLDDLPEQLESLEELIDNRTKFA